MRKTLPFFSKVFSFTQLKISDEQVKFVIEEINKCNFEECDKKESSSISLISNNKYFLEQKQLNFLKELLTYDFNQYVKEVYKWNNNFKITTSWISKVEPGKNSHWHNHNNCMYSGILYLQTDKNTGKIMFNQFDLKRFELEPTEWNDYNSNELCVEPKDKTLVYFPSEIFHKIEENKSNITRYSLAFNFTPIGVLGQGDSEMII